MLEEKIFFGGKGFRLAKQEPNSEESFQTLDVNVIFLFTSKDVLFHLKETYSEILAELHQQEEYDSMMNDDDSDILQRYMLVAAIIMKR